MSEYFCPRCGAMLSEDVLYAAADTFDCPECDEPIRLRTVAPEMATAENRLLAQESAVPESAALEAVEEETPPGNRLQCRVAGDQLVLYIPPGSSRVNRSIGLFAVIWLGFIGLFTGITLLSGGFPSGESWPVIPLLGLFWAVGLLMLYFWYRGRFGKTYVLVEADRLVTKFELFGREKFREYRLGPESRADLVESFQENHRPVYAIGVTTSGRRAKFGTFLSREEKDWIVARINQHLGR